MTRNPQEEVRSFCHESQNLLMRSIRSSNPAGPTRVPLATSQVGGVNGQVVLHLPPHNLTNPQMILRRGSGSARRRPGRNVAESAGLRWRRTRSRASVSSRTLISMMSTTVYRCTEIPCLGPGARLFRSYVRSATCFLQLLNVSCESTSLLVGLHEN